MNYEDRLEKREQEEAEREAQRIARPLVERLRDCGPFRASDGIMSVKTGDYMDAHEAADVIENLEEVITRLILAAGKLATIYPDAVEGDVEALTKGAIAIEQVNSIIGDILKGA